MNSEMSLDTLRRIVRSFFELQISDEKITILWHAGEPLIKPVQYYRSACDLILQESPKNIDIKFSIQTNGVLIDEKWCKFIEEYNISLGLSIDGPQFIHDHSRVYRNGRGSYEKVKEAIDLLHYRGQFFTVICVLTEKSLYHADEIYNWCRENQIREIGFNPEEIEGINKTSTVYNEESHQNLREFYKKFWDNVSEGEWEMNVREFRHSVSHILRQDDAYSVNSQQAEPWNIVTVAANGDFTTFAPELLHSEHPEYGQMIIGNLAAGKPFIDQQKLGKIRNEIDIGVLKCKQECEYFPFCGGGSPSNKLAENRDLMSTETQYCRLTKKIPIDVVLEKLEKNLI